MQTKKQELRIKTRAKQLIIKFLRLNIHSSDQGTTSNLLLFFLILDSTILIPNTVWYFDWVPGSIDKLY